jgi:hypothetical protein
MPITTEDLCKILHYALARETRTRGVLGLDRSSQQAWEDSPEEYKRAVRGAVSSMELVTRKDERDTYRREITECMDDLARNPRFEG